MNGLQTPPHGGREVRSYTANRRELRFGVVAAEAVAECLIVVVRGVLRSINGGIDPHHTKLQAVILPVL